MSRLLDVIVGSAIKRVKDLPFVKPAPLKPSTWVRQLHRQFVTADKLRDRRKAQLKKYGWEVNYRGRLELLDSRGTAAQRAFEAAKETRLRKIRDLRDQAMLDTLNLSPVELKAYLIRLKAKLEKL